MVGDALLPGSAQRRPGELDGHAPNETPVGEERAVWSYFQAVNWVLRPYATEETLELVSKYVSSLH